MAIGEQDAEAVRSFIDGYAELAVRVGANLQPGQRLRVMGSVEAVPLVRAVMEAGWEAGAGDVEGAYFDLYERYLLARHGDDEILDRTSVVARATLEAGLSGEEAHVGVFGDLAPAYFQGADEQRLARTQPREASEIGQRLVNGRTAAWTMIASPDESWAERVFGQPDVARLCGELAHACRLDTADPIAEWRAQLARLAERRTVLTERRFDRLHFRGPGTDLTVGLLPRSRWIGGEIETSWGQRHCPNVPTEEVFTTPDRNRTEGVVAATRPVAYPEGVLVEGIRLRFSNGRIVEADADRGEEFLRRHIATDEGAAMLGEVALVGESPTGERGVVYSHTLFDENAASHVAYGSAYATAVDGAGDLDRNALLDLGLNVSTVHVDFAIGGPNVEVDAIDKGGARTPVLRGTDWVLD